MSATDYKNDQTGSWIYLDGFGGWIWMPGVVANSNNNPYYDWSIQPTSGKSQSAAYYAWEQRYYDRMALVDALNQTPDYAGLDSIKNQILAKYDSIPDTYTAHVWATPLMAKWADSQNEEINPDTWAVSFKGFKASQKDSSFVTGLLQFAAAVGAMYGASQFLTSIANGAVAGSSGALDLTQVTSDFSQLAAQESATAAASASNSAASIFASNVTGNVIADSALSSAVSSALSDAVSAALSSSMEEVIVTAPASVAVSASVVPAVVSSVAAVMPMAISDQALAQSVFNTAPDINVDPSDIEEVVVNATPIPDAPIPVSVAEVMPMAISDAALVQSLLNKTPALNVDKSTLPKPPLSVKDAISAARSAFSAAQLLMSGGKKPVASHIPAAYAPPTAENNYGLGTNLSQILSQLGLPLLFVAAMLVLPSRSKSNAPTN